MDLTSLRDANLISDHVQLCERVCLGPFSVVESRVRIGSDTTIGSGAVIGEAVTIGAGCRIGHRVILHAGTQIGDECTIYDGAVIGRAPKSTLSMRHQISQAHAPARLAALCQVGANAVVYAGVMLAENVLVWDLASIREDCVIGAYTIVGRSAMIEYGCRIGPRVKIQTGCYR
jgi:UDP-2-acetamido-3-amino-2,3-dideoxy-glucuronate N-acetyltransferase